MRGISSLPNFSHSGCLCVCVCVCVCVCDLRKQCLWQPTLFPCACGNMTTVTWPDCKRINARENKTKSVINTRESTVSASVVYLRTRCAEKIAWWAQLKLKQARTLVNNYTASARLSAAAPSVRIGLPTSHNVCNVLFWLHVKHKHVLIRPHYQSGKNRVAPRKCLFEWKFMQRRKSDVRQGTTDRGSACITDLVIVEV